MKWLFNLFRKPKPRPHYVIVYDRSFNDEDWEEYYGYFSSPQEAWLIWTSYTENSPSRFTNVKLCLVVENWQENVDCNSSTNMS